jgi:DNA-binding NarL/FixJ family response regulator
MNAVGEGRAFLLNSKQADSGAATVRILLVDDFELFRTLAYSVLQEQPRYEIVGEAADGLEAVQRAGELKPDLVVLDIDLPKLNGFEVARRIRRCSPNSTILFLTAHSDSELARQALNAGARGYVLKVDVAKELVKAAKAVLSGERFVSRRLKESDANENR